MTLVHLVARMRRPYRLLEEWEHAAWLWERLRSAFPRTVAATVMPNHPHVLTYVDDPDAARGTLARTCGHLQRRLGVRDLFEPLPPAEVVTRDKAARVARYVDLNPCRAALVDHPLRWPWTTVRDLVGSVATPWVDRRVHGRALGRWRATSVQAWMEYLAQDDRVLDRRPLAEPVAGRSSDPAFGVRSLVGAACAAMRTDASAVRVRGPTRKLFVALAIDQGVDRPRLLAQQCGTTLRAVELARRRAVDRRWLEAARLCLADDRLTSDPPKFADRELRSA